MHLKVLALAAAVLALATPCAAADWARFTGEGFTADMPTSVTSKAASDMAYGETVTITIAFAAADPNTLVAVESMHVPKGDPQHDLPDAWLETNAGTFAKGLGTPQMVSMTTFAQGGANGREFLSRSDDGKTVLEGRIYREGDRAFILAVEHTAPSATPSADFKRLSQTFSITP